MDEDKVGKEEMMDSDMFDSMGKKEENKYDKMDYQFKDKDKDKVLFMPQFWRCTKIFSPFRINGFWFILNCSMCICH